MIVYSQKIIQFIGEIQRAIKNVLSQEIGLKVATSRFYDRKQRASYPIHAVIFNNKGMLGYFDPNFYELGFNECLMHASKQQLHNVIRHELAHYMTYINYGETSQPHSAEFRVFCEQMGWGEEVYRASTCLESEQAVSTGYESSVLRKVQKLMALSTSSNPHEAENALLKSQELLLKHNLESKYTESEEEEKIVLKRILKQKKENAKMRSIARILETFFVNTVYHRGKDAIYLEILGSRVNVEIAEYVAAVLQEELEKLWNTAQKHSQLKGMVAKNSFFQGIAKGYCNKVQALKREYRSEVSSALMVIEKKLMDAKEMAYPRLSTSRSSGGCCRESSLLGEKMGRQLSINPAINRSSTGLGALLT